MKAERFTCDSMRIVVRSRKAHRKAHAHLISATAAIAHAITSRTQLLHAIAAAIYAGAGAGAGAAGAACVASSELVAVMNATRIWSERD